MRWTCVGAALLIAAVGCTDEQKSVVSAPPDSASAELLPGETVSDAVNRIYDSCMDEFGQPFVLAESRVNGVPIKVRGYDHNSPLYSAEHDAQCMDRASAIIVPPSDEELKGSYTRTVDIVNCIRDEGFDIGVVVSEAEFVNGGGAVTMSSDWDLVASQSPPGFAEAIERCFAEFPPSAGD
jgi:hypothetical protein